MIRPRPLERVVRRRWYWLKLSHCEHRVNPPVYWDIETVGKPAYLSEYSEWADILLRQLG